MKNSSVFIAKRLMAHLPDGWCSQLSAWLVKNRSARHMKCWQCGNPKGIYIPATTDGEGVMIDPPEYHCDLCRLHE